MKAQQDGLDVKDVCLVVHAEVKLIKLMVTNIQVDISVNMVTGLDTLAYMEHANKLLGKDNLLKRSILLLKAYMTYDASIMGSHAACMASYGL